MSQQADAPQAAPSLCGAGCGFYSNVGTGGLCSKCFRDEQLRSAKALEAQQALAPTPPPAAAAAEAQATAAAPQEALPSTSSPAAAAAAPAEVASEATSSPAPPTKSPSPTRCFVCNKKVGLTGFSCKCQPEPAVFCSAHRMAEAHGCTWDWRAQQQKALATNNPQVQASKLQKL